METRAGMEVDINMTPLSLELCDDADPFASAAPDRAARYPLSSASSSAQALQDLAAVRNVYVKNV